MFLFSMPFTIFSKFDLRNSYHLVCICKNDEWKLAFNMPLGHFEYLVMPFGLTNAPVVFQALVNDVLQYMLNRFVLVYLDNILIFSWTLEEHVQHVRMVLQRLFEKKLFVNAEKCLFHSASVEFLGFFIEQWQVRSDPSKVQKVTYWLAPENYKQLQCFLGFANFYCHYIQDYSHVVSPLTQLTSTKLPFLWTSEADEAYTSLKELSSMTPALAHPEP